MASLKAPHKSLLECPVCYERLEPPVETCEKGHGICQKCRKSVEVCGICRKKFSGNNSTLLNQLLESISLQCKFNSQGCTESFSIGNIKNHEKACFYRKVYCARCFEEEIYLQNLNHHFESHSLSGQSDVKFSDYISIPIDILMWKDDWNRNYILRLTNNNTYFLIRFTYTAKNILLICMQYIGQNQQEARKYKYNIKIDQGLSPPNQSFFLCSCLCVPYISDNQETMKQEKIIQLDLKSIFFTKDYLSKAFTLQVNIEKLSKIY